jgi:hypothetical protein
VGEAVLGEIDPTKERIMANPDTVPLEKALQELQEAHEVARLCADSYLSLTISIEILIEAVKLMEEGVQ